MTILSDKSVYKEYHEGVRKQVTIQCDSGKNEKCLGIFTREWRSLVIQRKRIGDRDFCKFCQKTEEYTGRGNPNTKYFFDDTLFENIDSVEKAYILGWIASDGNIQNGKITIAIRDYDLPIIVKIRNFVDKEIPINICDSSKMVSVSFCSIKVVSDVLRHLGLEKDGHKSSTIKFPHQLQEPYIRYFLRGFFEGDGSVTVKARIPRVSIASNSASILEGFKEFFNYGSIYSKCQWQTTSGGKAIEFLNYVYLDAEYDGLYLERKYDIYVKCADWKPAIKGPGGYSHIDLPQGLIKFNKVSKDAILPDRLDIHASGIDLCITHKIKDLTEDTALYGTGIKVSPPEGYYFILVGRSSISKSGFSLANAIGIIDEDYIGEIMVALRKHGVDELTFPNRLVQLVLVPKINYEFVLVDSLEDTARGEGGFGSTGA